MENTIDNKTDVIINHRRQPITHKPSLRQEAFLIPKVQLFEITVVSWGAQDSLEKMYSFKSF